MLVAILSTMFGLGAFVCEEPPPGPPGILVVVANHETGEWVRQEMPRVRVAVLETTPDDSVDLVHARAWRFRNADCYFFDPETESPGLALVRERLKNHGVVPINLRRQVLNTPKRLDQPHHVEAVVRR